MAHSFKNWLKLREGMGFGMSEDPKDPREQAMTMLMTRYHGWPVEWIEDEITKPNFPTWLMGKMRRMGSMDQHGGDAREVIEAIAKDFGIKLPF